MIDLLNRITEEGIVLDIVDGELKLFADQIDIDISLLQEIKENKKEIVAYLIETGSLSTRKKKDTRIPAAPEAKSYPLSDGQRRLWIMSQYEEGAAGYNMPSKVYLEGSYSTESITEAMKAVVERHEILRTVFRMDEEGMVRQWVLPAASFSFEIDYQDFREHANTSHLVSTYLEADSYNSFDLENGPLFRAALLQISDDAYVFYYNMHHIISDGWSMNILARDILAFYEAQKTKTTPELPELHIQYKDFTVWQRSYLEEDRIKEHRNYWHEKLSGNLPVLDFPSAKFRPATKTFTGKSLGTHLSVTTTKRLKKFSQEQGGSMFMGLLAAWNVLCFRYTSENDIIIGSPVAGRDHADLEDQIGFYVNTLALRNQVDGKESFTEFFQRVKTTTLEAYTHQEYPFDKVVEDLDLTYEKGRSPVYDVSLTYHNTYDKHAFDKEEYIENETITDLGPLTCKIDLELHFRETENAFHFMVNYNTDVYEQAMIEKLMLHFRDLLHQLLNTPQLPLEEVEFISEKEKYQILFEFNDVKTPYPENKTLVQLFTEQAVKHPGAIALVFENTQLTYQEVDEISSKLARYLQEQYHIEPGDYVGILLNRSEWSVLSILAVLKTGAAYVPLDPELPNTRKKYIVNDTELRLLISETEYMFELGDFYEGTIFAVDVEQSFLECEPTIHTVNTDPQSVAYVMYTSGSTGNPKGVVITQKPIIRLVKNTNYIKIDQEDAILGLSNFSFDGSTFDVFMPLLNGATLVISSKDVFLDLDKLEALITEQNISAFFLTTVFFNTITEARLNSLQNLKYILFGGELVSVKHVREFKEQYPKVRLHHVYGPTENTTFSTYYPIETVPENTITIPIGRPVANSTAYILDANDKIVPVGITGEICLGGDGLSEGYLKQDDLTSEKFVENPYIKGAYFYRTGDLGKWMPDGSIVFMGRKDHQVKVRGHRIELGEIENALFNLESIEKAVVTVREATAGEKELVAYFMSPGEISVTNINNALKERLPQYMLPAYYVQVNEFPVTSNGKIDKKRLPDPAESNLTQSGNYIAPRNTSEEKLAGIWAEILQKERISINDDFFDLGGHSLKVTRLISQIHKEFQVKIELKELFITTTLEGQAQLIENALTTSYAEIPAVPVQESYPLSSSQSRLWILSQFEEANIAYNMPAVFEFEGDLDFEALTKAFNTLIKRHESLRTVFGADDDGVPYQVVKQPEEMPFQLEVADFRNVSDQKAKLRKEILEYTALPFDLSKGPLLKAKAYTVEENKWIFSYVMHHIISDGWSIDVFTTELLSNYDAFINNREPEYTPLRIHYKDYACWQKKQLEEGNFAAHREYWTEQLGGDLPVLQLPTDNPRPLIQTYNGSVVRTGFDKEQTAALKALCKEQDATLFMGLLSLLNILVYRYSNSEDIIFGTPIANREHADLDGQIGFYLNTLALRTRLKGTDSFRELLKNVREQSLNAYRYQAFPFDELMILLNIKRNMSRNPIFDITIALQNATNTYIEYSSEQIEGLRVGRYEEEAHKVSKFDMSFDFREIDDVVEVDMQYNTDIYKKQTVSQLLVDLKYLLEAATKSPDMPVNELTMISHEQQQEILALFDKTEGSNYQKECFTTLFEKRVTEVPEQMALVFEDRSLSYSDLNAKANKLARFITREGAFEKDAIVGVELERNEWLVIGLLAILKTGAAYLPVDIEYPEDRKTFMTSQSGCRYVLNRDEITKFLENEASYSGENLETVITPHQLAYVIYTSGSTGKPKGVMIEQHSFANFSQAYAKVFGLTEKDRVIQQSSISFDMHVMEIFPALLGGSTLLMGTNGGRDIGELKALVEEHNATVLSATPQALNELNSLEINLNNLRLVLSGGDKFNKSFVTYFIGKVEVYDLYGPSEVTVCSTFFKVADTEQKVSIGEPWPNRQIMILNEAGKLQPYGATGEICISGSGLARGYLNNPDITREKFVPHPFKPEVLMYRTGDLGKCFSDGSIEFVGRKDAQVKVRGYRIELGEIESTLQTHANILSAVVDIHQEEGKPKELIAYFTSNASLNASEIRAHLSAQLPGYMIPSVFIKLKQVPLTANGKINKSKLSLKSGEMVASGVPYEAPGNHIEKQLVAIWEELLKREKIGINDNFFELGGHSLTVTRLLMEVERVYDVKIRIKNIFEDPTVRGISEQIAFLIKQRELEENSETLKEINIDL